jgi:protocatechuate 3,4-dioxygenase beta subunit
MVSKLISPVVLALLASWTIHVTAEDDVQRSPQSVASPSAPVDQKLIQAKIQKLVKTLASSWEPEWKAAQKQLIEAGRAPVFELFKASESDDKLLAARALETWQALPKPDLNLRDATGQPVRHVFVEFFQLVPHSMQLPEAPFAYRATDHVSGFVVPELRAGQGIAMRVRIPDCGTTTITRVPPSKIWHTKQEHLNRNFRQLFLPIVTPDSPYEVSTLRGVVQDESGNPVKSAELLCWQLNTPGEGNVRGVQPLSCVVTRDDGRFQLSLPTWLPPSADERHFGRNYPLRILRTEPFTEETRYELVVRVPGDLTLCPARLWISNASEAVITLNRSTQSSRFEFESLAGEVITDESELAGITLHYQPAESAAPKHFIEDEWVEVDRRIILEGGPVHPGRYWASYQNPSRRAVFWEMQELGENSPAVVRVRMSPPVTFRGRVVDGMNGQPLSGVYVGGTRSHTSGRYLASVTAEEWTAAEQLPAAPALDAEALEPFLRVYGFRKIVRTDEDGRFQLVQQPDDRYSSVIAFARHKLQITTSVFRGERFSDIPDLPLLLQKTSRNG